MQAKKLKILAAAVALATPLFANANTGTDSGAGALSAQASLSFRITIPRFIFLRVGAAATISELLYTPTLAQITTPTPVVAASGGDVAGTDVTFQAFGNAGNLTLASSALTLAGPAPGMSSTTLTGVAQTGSVAPPAWSASSALTAGAGGVVNQSGTWRYSWQATAATLYAPGDYTGTAVYTLSAP